jgi:hypothetical protein
MKAFRLVPSRSVSFRLARTAEIAAAAALLVFTANAMPAPQGTHHEEAVGAGTTPNGTYPQDSALTSNFARGAVRFANPSDNTNVIQVWTMPTTGYPTSPAKTYGGGTLRSGNQTTLLGGVDDRYRPSDRIELANLIGVSIGSGDSGFYSTNDETYIERFSTSGASTIVQHVISPGTNPATDRAGQANDLEITFDGQIAVVNSNNWIHFLDLTTANTIHGENIGAYPTYALPCTPDGAVDSVAVTNDRAIVTTARFVPNVGFRTYVYIADLTSWPPTIVMEDFLDPPNPPTGEPWNLIGDRPHDVAIDPTESMAVVTTTHQIALYDLVNPGRINAYFDPDDWRIYQVQVDSVELTDEVAIVISDNYPLANPPASLWHVQVFQIANLPPSGMVLIQEYFDPGDPESHAHDLGISRDFDKGVVRTGTSNVVLTSLSNPPPMPTILASPNGSDAYAYQNWRDVLGYDIFSSDSVAITPRSPDQSQTAVIAVTIGGFQGTNGVWHGAADFIDLTASTLTAQQVDLPSNMSVATDGCVPVDVDASTTWGDFAVRSADPVFSSNSTQESDVVVLQWGAPPSIQTWYRGTGTVMGLDSLAMTTTRLVSTTRCLMSSSQDAFTTSGFGYVHIAD